MSTYSSNLKIELIGTGEQVGTWGTTTNSNFANVFEQAIVGRGNPNYASDANLTLTYTDSVASQTARNLYLNVTSTVVGGLTATRELVVPTINKNYIIQNNTTGGQSITVKTSAGTGVTIPNGTTVPVYVDGTNVIQAFDYLPSLNIGTLDLTNIEVTNIKAKDGTASASIANSTGVMTINSSVLTTTDINGGTIDNTSIGATTPSTVVATQVDIVAQGDLRLQDTTGGQFVALQAPGTVASSYTLTLPVDDGTNGQALITDGNGVLSWSTAASGDVYGPASSTDNAIARFDSTTGKLLQNSSALVDDAGNVLAGAGLVGAPAFSTTGDTNTGIFFPAADTIAFTEGGVEAMRIDSSANLLIGTTTNTNSSRLVANGTISETVSSAQYLVASQYDVGTDPNQIPLNQYLGSLAYQDGNAVTLTGGSISGNYSSTGLNIDSNTLVIDATNNLVGIGTSTPQTNLSILAGTATGQTIPSGGRFLIDGNNGNNWIDIFASTTGAMGIRFGDSGASQQGRISYQNNGDYLDFWSNGSERMRIDANGNIGIGTTSIGGNSTNRIVKAYGSTSAAVQAQSSATTISLGAGGSEGYVEVSGAYPMLFYTNSGERMRITSTGAVGIGTSSPAQKLDVNGNIIFNGNMFGATGSGYWVSGNNAYGAGINGDGSTGNVLKFHSSNAERMRLDASGNLGLAVTPSAWASSWKALQIGGQSLARSVSGAGDWTMAFNAYFDTTDSRWEYLYTGDSSVRYSQTGAGIHAWYTSGSGGGTANNPITFTQAMTLNSSGVLLVGTTTTTNNLRLAQKLALVTAGTTSYGGMSITNYGNANADVQGLLDFNRSKGTTDGSMTIVANSDSLGAISFRGSDGTNFIDAVFIRAEVDGTPGTNDMPGRLVFATTADGASSATERMRINSRGNLGLGVAPSAWGSGWTAMQIRSGGLALWTDGGQRSFISTNLYYDGTNRIYQTTGYATEYNQSGDGKHQWYTAASGTAGNAITFTQTMTLDASGNLGIGNTSPSTSLGASKGLVIYDSNNSPQIRLQTSITGSGTTDGGLIAVDSSSPALMYVWNYENGTLIFGTNNTERMRITSAGSLLVGTTTTYGKITSQQNDSGGYEGAGLTMVRSSNTNRWSFVIAASTDDLYLGYNAADRGYFNISTGAYSAVSDGRLKKNIADISYGLNEILALRSVTYNMNDQEDTGVKALGFIAQEAMQVIPESVSEMMGGMYGMDKLAIVPVLVKAIQEQQAIINDLTTRLTALENK
jgi:hypothetical protein